MEYSNLNYPGSPNPRRGHLVLIIVIILFLIAAVGAAYFYRQYRTLKNKGSKTAQEEGQATVAAVGKLIVLPTDEQPTVATVTDPSKLGNQAFFAHAKVGDKVLLYATAKKAILYDPNVNKIIEVAPINLDDSNAPTVTGAGTTPTSDNKK
jgi:hypothetical protein